MKTAINGVRYDTDAAVLIGRRIFKVSPHTLKTPPSDRWAASLYMTPRSGRLFLFGWGGFMTRFKGRENVFIELTQDEMLTWTKEYLPKKALHDNPDITARQIKKEGKSD